ncbi:MAG: helix-turn-helix transcriptional regulator [Thermincola sp.]|nr:helix-turn-helix transcriptional regulator [Thermincola sp.]MDT3701995.1 helix-turn-helix transcriptional regulator [Thermincola sp.]
MSNEVSYTPEEVAKILKISRFTVYDLIKRGDLVAYRIGRKVRVEPTDLEAYKQRGKGINSAIEQPVTRHAESIVPVDDGLIICGQDIILDILTRHLEKKTPHVRFLRQYIGSIDGLLSLYRGTANVVTAHLWDGDTDEYNIPYIRRLLPGHKTMVVNLAYRNEGFYVAKGNPKGIKDWNDLTRADIRFINRERGSGARVLLDEKLRKQDIAHEHINGYKQEEMSHLAVASCVARGDADVGLGIEKASAQVKETEFIPLKKERYDLVIRKDDFDKPQFLSLMAVLKSESYRNEVEGMGGYDISQMGEVMAEIK